jgi:hypothetical protein
MFVGSRGACACFLFDAVEAVFVCVDYVLRFLLILLSRDSSYESGGVPHRSIVSAHLVIVVVYPFDRFSYLGCFSRVWVALALRFSCSCASASVLT